MCPRVRFFNFRTHPIPRTRKFPSRSKFLKRSVWKSAFVEMKVKGSRTSRNAFDGRTALEQAELDLLLSRKCAPGIAELPAKRKSQPWVAIRLHRTLGSLASTAKR